MINAKQANDLAEKYKLNDEAMAFIMDRIEKAASNGNYDLKIGLIISNKRDGNKDQKRIHYNNDKTIDIYIDSTIKRLESLGYKADFINDYLSICWR